MSPSSSKGATFVSIFFFTILQMNQVSDAAKILLLPVTQGSHLMTMQQLGTALAERGHELHTVMNEECKGVKKMEKIGIINHGYKLSSGCSEESPETMKRVLDMVFGGFSLFKMRRRLSEASHSFANNYVGMLSNKLLSELKKENFDIAIVDAIFLSRPMYILPYRLGIPTISVGAAVGLLDAGVPALPSFIPFVRDGKYNNRMTFFQRVHNTLLSVLLDKMTSYVMGHSNAVAEYAPEMPFKTLEQLLAESSLWLIMNDGAIDYPQVSLPHVINMGGINTRPAKPLTGEFKQIADGAKDGLVIVSFGSIIGDLPPTIMKRLYDDLKLVKKTLIWRYTGQIPDDLPPNMHLVKWMPQNDLLAHPNTKVFVTHCGCNGQFEALYSGVPMVGMPIFGDQRYNAIRMVNKGMGIHTELLKFNPGELNSAIQEVLHNDSYSKAMKKYSTIFRSQPMTPIERAMFWIEHVIEFGHEHLRPPAVDMPWYQYWCVDVILFLMFVITLVLSLFVAFLCFVFRKCKARFYSKKQVPTSAKPKKKHQ